MSNILNHNRNIFDFYINRDEYWDFILCLDSVGSSSEYDSNSDDCLSVFIDTDDNDCVWFDDLTSKSEWYDSVNGNMTLDSIGFTGVDNGIVLYEKDKITNKEFLDLFLDTHMTLEGTNFKLKKVNGNNQLYDYTADITYDENIQVAKLNGGFYQGFFKVEDKDYQVLPDSIDKGWCFSFVLKKEDFINENDTLNKKHPQNKGIFFYIGTRAENKWYKYYKTDGNYEVVNHDYCEDYSDEYTKITGNTTDYVVKEEKENEGDYFSDNYVKKNNYFDAEADCCDFYVTEEYVEKDVEIKKDENLKTEEGYNLYQPNIVEIKTDNKFITYNRSKDGLCIGDGHEDEEVIIYDVKVPNMENYFLLFDRTCKGYTTDTIDELIEEKSKVYDIYEDLYRNALAFQITDDGEIGYKYLVRDCENPENYYKIESEFSNKGVINEKSWYNVSVKVEKYKKDEMILYFYVNGKLVLVSRPLPMLNLRKLNDLSSKQEGVPYNISIGGGTQGLCDVVYIDYMNDNTVLLPIEKEFGGTFIGYIKEFKFYTCPVNFEKISKDFELSVISVRK